MSLTRPEYATGTASDITRATASWDGGTEDRRASDGRPQKSATRTAANHAAADWFNAPPLSKLCNDAFESIRCNDPLPCIAA
mmetsp:Transcript_10980/g.39730  ORF Transcript_10980/g.39730 Transcript_10980/m.39730 type:complete len:82 (+) Transcript_10980:76-321(+)|eukprot:31032-Pelagococcus_subviridis.AAC.23